MLPALYGFYLSFVFGMWFDTATVPGLVGNWTAGLLWHLFLLWFGICSWLSLVPRLPGLILHLFPGLIYLFLARFGTSRETREGWLLLTVKTEVNGGSKSIHERDPFLVGTLGPSFWYKRFLFRHTALAGPVQNIFSSPYTITIPLSLSPINLGNQPCWVAFS